MEKFKRPMHFIWFVALPLCIMLLFLTLSGALDAPSLPWAFAAVMVLGAEVVFAFVYGIACRAKESTPLKTLLPLLVVHTVFSVLLTAQLFIRGATQAGVSPEIVVLICSSVPMLYLSMQVCLCRVAIPTRDFSRQLVLSAGIPFLCAVGLSGIDEANALNTILLTLSIALICAALFFLARWGLSYARKLNRTREIAETPPNGGHRSRFVNWLFKAAHNWIVIFIIAIVMPQVGLGVNLANYNMFGDFSSPWYFILAAINGLVMLPVVKRKWLSLPMLFIKLCGFAYILYFFLTFIPLMPIGFIGILAAGLGLLIFVPFFVLLLEILQIIDDVNLLRKRRHGAAIALVMVAGLLTIPAVFTANAYIDRVNYNHAQAYMDPAGAQQYDVDTARLGKTILRADTYIDALSSRGGGWGSYSTESTALLNRAYNRIVFKDRIMSRESLGRMAALFLDWQDSIWAQTGLVSGFLDSATDSSSPVLLTDVRTETAYDAQARVYKTWVHLNLTNTNAEAFGNEEYATQFTLPEGCFINDYYLDVGGTRKYGMLTDKRAALISYQSVVRRAQDPGLLYYTALNTVELRVFPFNGYETRETGFCVMHSQPAELTIDGNTIKLEAPAASAQPLDMGSVRFVPAAYKQNLTPVTRQAQYYFVVDTSRNSPVYEHLEKINDYTVRHGIQEAQVIFAGYKTYAVKLSELPSEILPGQSLYIGGQHIEVKGGFNLGAAMYHAMQNELQSGTDSFPIIIGVSDNLPSAYMPGNLTQYTCFPESAYYYNLNYDASLTPYRFAGNQRLPQDVREPIIEQVLRYGDSVVSAQPVSETIYIPNTDPNAIAYGTQEYRNAFLLTQKSILQGQDLDVVRDSFRQKLLAPGTAFIVLETQQQEADLLSIQENIMNGGAAEVPTVSMAEPMDLLFALGVTVLLLIFARLRKKRQA